MPGLSLEDRRKRFRQLQRFYGELKSGRDMMKDRRERDEAIATIVSDPRVLSTAKRVAPLVANGKRIDDDERWPPRWETRGALKTFWPNFRRWAAEFDTKEPGEDVVDQVGGTNSPKNLSLNEVHSLVTKTNAGKGKAKALPVIEPTGQSQPTAASKEGQRVASKRPRSSSSPASSQPGTLVAMKPGVGSGSRSRSRSGIAPGSGSGSRLAPRPPPRPRLGSGSGLTPVSASTPRPTTVAPLQQAPTIPFKSSFASKASGHPASRARNDLMHNPHHGPMFQPRAPKGTATIELETLSLSAGASETGATRPCSVSQVESSFDVPVVLSVSANEAALSTNEASSAASPFNTPPPKPAPTTENAATNQTTGNESSAPQNQEQTPPGTLQPVSDPSYETLCAFYAWWAKGHNRRYREEHGPNHSLRDNLAINLSVQAQHLLFFTPRNMSLKPAFAEAARRREARARDRRMALDEQANVEGVSSAQLPMELVVANVHGLRREPLSTCSETHPSEALSTSSETHPSEALSTSSETYASQRLCRVPDTSNAVQHVTKPEFDDEPDSKALVHAAIGHHVSQYQHKRQHQHQAVLYDQPSGSSPMVLIDKSAKNATTINNNYSVNYNPPSGQDTSATPAPNHESNTASIPDQTDNSSESNPDTVVGAVLYMTHQMMFILGYIKALFSNKFFFYSLLALFVVVHFIDLVAFCWDLVLGNGKLGALIRAQLGVVSGVARKQLACQCPQQLLGSSALQHIVGDGKPLLSPSVWDRWWRDGHQDVRQQDFEASKSYAEAHVVFNREFIDKMEGSGNAQYWQLITLRNEITFATAAYKESLARPWWKWWGGFDSSSEGFQQRLLSIIDSMTQRLSGDGEAISDLVSKETQAMEICQSKAQTSGFLEGPASGARIHDDDSSLGMICETQKRTDQRWKDINPLINEPSVVTFTGLDSF
ncbi:hypothetical protein EDB81DRAFT_768683 [Dactylonectria macrodidyma]|uniref:Uncharacterized protein n=1 Tax=Dactylonectria macrodidyma TaxID=307937 RepID=A0A9P9D2E6_9HYPO|nr:hypothetical protein EDB81DRAFT_768683 [Dactylonectria macrodidyma]